MDKSDIIRLIEAFDRLAVTDFMMGDDWQQVHEICQAHEGEKAFDWGHAICHRIEGDDLNADYWYRRAGKKRLGSVAEDWAAMRAELSKTS